MRKPPQPKIVIIAGAGSTLSDASGGSKMIKPPLDAEFFSIYKSYRTPRNPLTREFNEFKVVRDYMVKNYSIDPCVPEYNRLEKIMGHIYADLHRPSNRGSVNEFRSLVRLFNRRIARTTNRMKISKKGNLYRIIVKKLSEGISPEDISIITFNQDIHVEKVLYKIQSTNRYKNKEIFSFPRCYRLNQTHKVTKTSGNVRLFPSNLEYDGIALYKLHGSLNWYTKHTSKKVPLNRLLSRDNDFSITQRIEIMADMSYKKRRTLYTFPVIVPPVTNKASVMPEEIHSLWDQAGKVLEEANEIVVFGYSCPEVDSESSNLLRRSINKKSRDLYSFTVIDTSPETLSRYTRLINLEHMEIFRTAGAFLRR